MIELTLVQLVFTVAISVVAGFGVSFIWRAIR